MVVLARPSRSTAATLVVSVLLLFLRSTRDAKLQALLTWWELSATEESGTLLNSLPCLGTAASQAVLIRMTLQSGAQHTVRILLDIPSRHRHKLKLLIFFAGASLGPEHYGWLSKLPLAVVRVPSVHDPTEHNRCTVADGIAVLSAVREFARTNPRFPLYGRLDGTVLLGGHSFGGGVAIEVAMHALAATRSAPVPVPIAGLLMLAPQMMNNPWGNTARAASSIRVPALVVGGEMDCSATGPSAVHASTVLLPLLPARRKALVVLAGHGHEGWARRPCRNDSHYARTALNDRGPCHVTSREGDRSSLSAIGDGVGAEVIAAFLEYTQSLAIREPAAWGRFIGQMAQGVSERRWWYTEGQSAEAAAEVAARSRCPCANNATFMAELSDAQMQAIGRQAVASFASATAALEAQQKDALDDAFWASASGRPMGSCVVDTTVYPSSMQAECTSERFRFCWPNLVCEQPSPICWRRLDASLSPLSGFVIK